MPHGGRATRHGEVLRAGLRQRPKQGPHSAKIVVRDANADAERCNQHQGVFQDAHPRHGANSAGENESGDNCEGNQNSCRAADAVEAGHLHDDSQACKLQLQVRDNEEHSQDRNQASQVLVSVSLQEIVGLGVQAVLASDLPDFRQNEKRDGVAEMLCVGSLWVRVVITQEK